MASTRGSRSIARILLIVGIIGLAGRIEAQTGPSRSSPSGPKVDAYGDVLPPGAVMRLGTVKYRQDSPIHRIAYTPDGKHFVTDGEDSIIRVWDASTGRVVRRIDPGVGALEDFAIARRGNRVMAVGRSVEPGPGFVQHVTVTDLLTGRIEDRGEWPDDDTNAVRAISLSPEGQLVAIGTTPSGVRLVDAWNGVEVGRLETGGMKPDLIVFSPDGKRLAVEAHRNIGSDFEWSLRIYDAARREELKAIQMKGLPYSDVVFSPDSKLIAASSPEDLDIWILSSGDRLSLGTPFIRKVGFSSDGRTLAGMDHLGVVRVFDLHERKLISSGRTGLDKADEVALSPDGRTLLLVNGEQAVHAWEIEGRRDRFPVKASHSAPARAILFTPDAKTIVSGGADSTVRLWDAGTGQQTRILRSSGPVKVMAISGDGRKVAAASTIFHQVFIWDLTGRDGPIVLSFSRTPELSMPLAMRFIDPERLLLIDASGRLQELDVKARSVKPAVQLRLSLPDADSPVMHNIRHTGAAFLPGRNELALLGLSSGLHLLDLATGKERFHVEGGEEIAASPDGRLVAVGAKGPTVDTRVKRLTRIVGRGTGIELAAVDGEVRLVEAATGKVLRRMAVQGSQPWAMAFSPDGRTLAVTSGWESGQIDLHEVGGDRGPRSLVGPRFGPSALAFMPSGSRLISGMADGSILVWDVAAAR